MLGKSSFHPLRSADCNQRRPINTQVNANFQVLVRRPWKTLAISIVAEKILLTFVSL